MSEGLTAEEALREARREDRIRKAEERCTGLIDRVTVVESLASSNSESHSAILTELREIKTILTGGVNSKDGLIVRVDRLENATIRLEKITDNLEKKPLVLSTEKKPKPTRWMDVAISALITTVIMSVWEWVKQGGLNNHPK